MLKINVSCHAEGNKDYEGLFCGVTLYYTHDKTQRNFNLEKRYKSNQNTCMAV